MRVVIALALLSLAACRAPAFEGANERGGIVRVWHGTTEEAFNLADAHCRRYGRAARVTNTVEFPRSLIFACE
jgi:hypothetical protein